MARKAYKRKQYSLTQADYLMALGKPPPAPPSPYEVIRAQAEQIHTLQRLLREARFWGAVRLLVSLHYADMIAKRDIALEEIAA